MLAASQKEKDCWSAHPVALTSHHHPLLHPIFFVELRLSSLLCLLPPTTFCIVPYAFTTVDFSLSVWSLLCGGMQC